MHAEPLYESLNPLSYDVLAAVVQFPKSEPFNRKFRKFRDETRMERKLPGKKNRKFGLPQEAVLFFENYVNS